MCLFKFNKSKNSLVTFKCSTATKGCGYIILDCMEIEVYIIAECYWTALLLTFRMIKKKSTPCTGNFKYTLPWYFPGGSVVKIPPFQCTRCRFDSWSGNQDPTCHVAKKKKKKKNTSGIETLYDLSVHLQGLQPKNSSFRLILFYPQMSCFCIGLNQGTNWDACELGRL